MTNNQKICATAYVDHFIEESDSNIWYDYVFSPVGSQEDISASNIVFALPQTATLKSFKSAKNGNSEKTLECHTCNTKFSNLSNLKSHQKIHSRERPYVCELCNQSFVQNSNLKAHRRLHTGERPYACKECGKTFARSSHLNGHRRIHTGELPYICECCSKSFSTSSQLKKHKFKHQGAGTNYMCNVCEESFSTFESLTLHKKLHSKERPFRCTFCMASFRSREDLHTHKKLHPGSGSPYVCNNCGKGFKIKFCCEKHYEKCVAEYQSKNEQNKISFSDGTLQSNNDTLMDCNIEADRLKSNAIEKVFLFEDGRLKEICNMNLMEENIEEGIDGEEQTVVVSIDDGVLFA